MDLDIRYAEIDNRDGNTTELTWKDIYSIDHGSPVVDITVLVRRQDLLRLLQNMDENIWPDSDTATSEQTYGELKWTPESWYKKFGDMRGFPWNEANRRETDPFSAEPE